MNGKNTAAILCSILILVAIGLVIIIFSVLSTIACCLCHGVLPRYIGEKIPRSALSEPEINRNTFPSPIKAPVSLILPRISPSALQSKNGWSAFFMNSPAPSIPSHTNPDAQNTS